MGLFKKKNVCSFCGSDKSVNAIKDGYVCRACLKKCGHYGEELMTSNDLVTLQDIKEKTHLYEQWVKEQERRKSVFNPNTRIGAAIIVDEKNRLWQCMTGKLKFDKPDGIIYTFDDISEYTVEEISGDTVTKGGTGRAIAGGLAFGGAGAVVGGVTGKRKTCSVCLQMYVVVTFTNFEKAYITLMPGKSNTSGSGSRIYSSAVERAKEVISYFDKMSAENTKSTNTSQVESTSIADELKKYSDLFESGVLSETEYNEIKEKLISKL